MATTSHLGMTLVEQAQAQKEVTVNTAFSRIDAVLNTGAKDKDLATPPGSPAAGDVYIVAASPTGDWSGQAGKIAYFDQIWRFIAPNEGMTLWVNDEDGFYVYNGSAWALNSPTVANDSISFAKMQNIASARLIGRATAGSGDPEELSAGTGLGIASGALGLTGGKQTVWIPAAAMRPSASGGCAALALVATSANRPDLSTLDFDASVEEYAQFWLAMPKSWNESTVTAQFLWSHASAATNYGVAWGIQGVSISDDDTVDVAFGTAQTVVDTGGTASDLYISAETGALTLAGSPAEGDMAAFRVYRKAADAADNLAVDARLHGVRLFFTTNAGTDD